MLKHLESLILRQDAVGTTLTSLLVKRGIIELLVREGTSANNLLNHARFQLSLRCGANNANAALMKTSSVKKLQMVVDALNSALKRFCEKEAELDEFTVVQEAPEAVADLAFLLDDNRQRREEIKKLLQSWQEALVKAAHA